MQDVLAPALSRHFGRRPRRPAEALLGAEQLADAVFVDQSPSARPRAPTPASYVGAFDEIRKLFADTSMARERSYTAGHFSFNAGDGRCPTCGGSGLSTWRCSSSDVYLRCPDRRQALPRRAVGCEAGIEDKRS